MKHGVAGRRRYHDGELHGRPEHFACRPNGTCVESSAGYQIHPFERLPIPPQRKLAVCSVSGVVVIDARQPGVRDSLEIERREQLIQAWNAAVITEWVLLRA